MQYLLFVYPYDLMHYFLFKYPYDLMHYFLFVYPYDLMHYIIFVYPYDLMHYILFVYPYDLMHYLLFVYPYDLMHYLLFVYPYDLMRPKPKQEQIQVRWCTVYNKHLRLRTITCIMFAEWRIRPLYEYHFQAAPSLHPHQPFPKAAISGKSI